MITACIRPGSKGSGPQKTKPPGIAPRRLYPASRVDPLRRRRPVYQTTAFSRGGRAVRPGRALLPRDGSTCLPHRRRSGKRPAPPRLPGRARTAVKLAHLPEPSALEETSFAPSETTRDPAAELERGGVSHAACSSSASSGSPSSSGTGADGSRAEGGGAGARTSAITSPAGRRTPRASASSRASLSVTS